jgi:hypothetical protein
MSVPSGPHTSTAVADVDTYSVRSQRVIQVGKASP